MGSNDNNPGVGGKLGNRLVDLAAQAVITTKAGLAGHHRVLGASIVGDFFDLVSGEVRHTTSDFYSKLADHPATPPDFQKLFQFMARGNGQWQTLLGGSLTGAIVGGGLGTLFTDWLAPVTQPLLAADPNLLLSTGDAANAEARGMAAGFDMGYESLKQGLSREKFDILVELSRNRPDVSVILDLVNRGIMSRDFALAQLQRLGYDTGDSNFLLETRRTLLTPASLADMVVRDIMPQDQAAEVASQSGLTAEDFNALVLDTGEPPSIQDLLFTHRRGFIDQARLQHGIRQSRVRTEWMDVIESLAFVPMSTADAIEGAVQNHLTVEQSKAITAQNGLDPEHWQVLYDNAGNPPGVQEMVTMYHRGKLTLAELIQGIRESRLKDKYIQPTIDAAPRIPPERSIVSLVSKGGLTEAEGTDLLLQLGFTAPIAAALMQEAHATKTVKAHTLTESMVTTLYEDNAMTAEDATGILEGLGYSSGDAAWLLALADANRAHKYQQAVITRVGSSYVKGLTDEQTARVTLQGLGMPAKQIDQVVSYWNIEIHTVSKTLTEAQTIKAAKDGFITTDQATARLLGMGYGSEDAAVLLAPVAGPPPGSPAASGG